MKILIAHNDYGKPSGEETVVERMERIFRDLGHEVAQLRMSTADSRDSLAGKLRVFAAGIHSPAGVRAMREALEREKPDVVNVHNLYPFISPAALRECRRAGVPVVMTVHNFRLICPTGLFMRNGAPCELCLERGNEWGCVRHNCEQSWPKSVAYASRNALARIRRHYLDCVDRFACITDFQRKKLIEAGFPAEKITVIPNAIEADTNDSGSSGVADKIGEYVAFIGRLSSEKGIDLIIESARSNPDIPFRLAGAVADKALVADLPPNVELKGFLSGSQLAELYEGARFVILASRCYEGFPMAILEAARFSRATIGPNHGGFTEILGSREASAGEHPLLFTPGSASDLSRKIRNLWDNPSLAISLGKAAHSRLLDTYTIPVVSSQWQTLLDSLRVVPS